MNVLILEDEAGAAERLQELLASVAPSVHVMAVLETVRDALAWFRSAGNRQPDLIFSDIQLGDGLSFEALQEAGVKTPVIFTTAYDAYTLRAFKLNSIDYLLKPIDRQELKDAIDKYHALQPAIPQQLISTFAQLAARKSYKSRFLVKQGDRLLTIPVADVSYIRASDKVVFLHTALGSHYFIDEPLDELEQMLNPLEFFRINRTYITALSAIDKINSHFKGRLKVTLRNCPDNDIFVSRARVADFKDWLSK